MAHDIFEPLDPKELKAMQVSVTKGCVWCGQQIRDDDKLHPQYCDYFQEYLRQLLNH